MEIRAAGGDGLKTPATAAQERILCICPVFPPAADSEAFCSGKLALAVREAGAEMTVLSFDPVSRGSALDPSPLWEPLLPSTRPIPNPPGRDPLLSSALALRFMTPTYPRWLGALLGEARRLHRESPFTLVHSRSLPMIAHVAGYWASRALRLPWAANINDPWDWHLFPEGTGMPKPWFHARVSDAWMRKTLRCAGLVTFPSERLRDYHLRLAGTAGSAARTGVVPHVGIARPAEPREEGFLLVHAGKLGAHEPTGRSSLGLLQALRSLLDRDRDAPLRLLLVGPEDAETSAAAAGLGLSGRVRSTGRVSYEQSLGIIAGASVCLLVEGKLAEGIFFPSKLADYLAAGRPVLALSPRAGTVADFALQGGILRADADDPGSILQALTTCLAAWRAGSLDRLAPPPASAGLFSPGRVSRILLDMIAGMPAEGCRP